MKRLTATTVLCLLLFSAAFVTGKGPSAAPEYPDSLRSVWLYTEGVKQNAIAGDSVRARELFLEAIRNDSTYAPAYYELAANGMYATPDEAVELARKAFRLDPTNKWYHQFYGQALIYAGRYDEALKVYRRLQTENPKDPDNYRILAALYEQKQSPVMALVPLDSAELRFGRIPVLSAMKRRLLVATNQIDKAVVEARAMVEAAPYEAQRHVVLGDLYAIAKKDSLARAEYDRALQIDSTNVQTLMALADFHAGRQDYRTLLAVTRQLFQSDELPLETKIKRFGQFTSDTRFYREYYFQLNDLASTLAIRGLALGEIEPKDLWKVLWKEVRVALMLGFVLALVNFLRIWFLTPYDRGVAFVVSIAMFFTIIIAKGIGATLPLLAKSIHLDPALMASPIITTLVDAASLTILFTVATVVFHLPAA